MSLFFQAMFNLDIADMVSAILVFISFGGVPSLLKLFE